MVRRLGTLSDHAVGDDVKSVIVMVRSSGRHRMNRPYAALLGDPLLVLSVVQVVFMRVVRIVLMVDRKPVEQSMSMQMRRAVVLSTWYRMRMGYGGPRNEQRNRQASDE